MGLTWTITEYRPARRQTLSRRRWVDILDYLARAESDLSGPELLRIEVQRGADVPDGHPL